MSKIAALSRVVVTVMLGLYGIAVHAQQTNKPAATAPVNATVHVGQDYTNGVPTNYVRSWDALLPTTDANAITGATYKDARQATQYIDGVGRPLQTVFRQITQGSAPKDIVSPVEYDAFGREVYKYLPYVSAEDNGSLKMSPFSAQTGFYQGWFTNQGTVEEHVYYSQTEYEASPLNRIKKAMAPGDSWAGSGKGASMEYLSNKPEDAVRILYINSTPLTYDAANNIVNDVTTNIPFSSSATTYNAGTLYKYVTIDEANNAIVEYKDKEGRLVLKKVQIGDIATDYSGYTGFLCTYYVYDDLNQIRFIIPPKAVSLLTGNGWQFTSDIINELCFRYEYDDRNRMIAKKVPGAGWSYMVYDARDRMVFMQDANMRTKHQWMTTLYDAMNRIVMTGMMTWNGGTTTDLQATVTSQTTSIEPPAGLQNELTLPDAQHPLPPNGFAGVHQAYSSIFLDVGFVSDIEFSAQIAGGTNGGPANVIIDGANVNSNPIPEGATFTALTKNFYDEYGWANGISYSNGYNSNLDDGKDPVKGYNLHAVDMPSAANMQTKTMITGTMVRVIDNPDNLAAGAWLTTVTFYDNRSRVLQVNSQTHKGRDIATNRYDFTGRVICSYMDHTLTGGVPASLHVKTNLIYDHAGRLMEVWKTINDNDVQKAVIVKNEYDDLGQLKTKNLGRKRDDNGVFTGEALGTFAFNYNIRGWLSGINKEYANGNAQPGIASPWFGMELDYDRGFEKKQLTGNVAGTKWRSAGDGIARAYGYTYDKANRILGADFSQNNGNGYIDDNMVNFDVKIGTGLEDGNAYDENGNIKAMTQWGLKVNNSVEIDHLTYHYAAGEKGNRLISVGEQQPGIDNKMGDFTDNNTAGDDYSYDNNGNAIRDLNKRISGIAYNYMNLPWEIQVKKDATTEKGKINYTYNATGNKIKKISFEQNVTVNYNGADHLTSVTTTTDYVEGFVYESKSYGDPALSALSYADKLLFFENEEGRTRYIAETGTSAAHFEYDYFVKDHLGNVRMVLTEEQQKDLYQAVTFEDANVSSEQIYYERVDVQRVTRSGNGSDKEQLLRKNTQSIGAGKLLKVMAADKLHIRVDYYTPNDATDNSNANGLESVIAQLLSLLNSAAAPGPVHGSGDIITSDLQNSFSFTSFLQPQTGTEGSTMPKAYLNILFFDEQFRFVPDNSEIVPITAKGVEQTLMRVQANAKVATKNGYVYIYVSNESNNLVYFDNLQITHERGPVLEETHYYPFGLKMAGISSRAMNTLENAYWFNDGTEFNNDLDISLYETMFRGYDPQIGRFHQMDQLADFYHEQSPYVFSFNNPVNFNDPLGLEGELPYFHNSNELLDYIQQHGISAFGEGFTQYVFGDNGESVSVTYDPNPTVGRNKKGERGLWVHYGYSLDNGYSEEFGHTILGEVVVGTRFFKADYLLEGWENYTDYLEEHGLLKEYWTGGLKKLKLVTSLTSLAIYKKLPPIATRIIGKEGWWLGENFKYNRLGWGGNQYTGARSAAKALSSRIGVATKVLGGATAVISAVQAYNDYQHGNMKGAAIHTADAVMGVVGLMGPVGAAISTVYFVSRIFWGNDD